MSAQLSLRVPHDVAGLVARLHEAGHEAFVVGGCVRDALRGVEPGDWDIATSAKPEAIQTLFRRSLYTNRFGTVVVQTGDREVEVTTYRVESDYADHRRPATVAFTESLEADLSRRDFTMNAMAWRPSADGGELVDPFGGRADLERRVLRAVGDPGERFAEDALRMLRAVRFATTFGLEIDPPTARAIGAHAGLAAKLSGERIQQELRKILAVPTPSTGFRMLADLGLLRVICPELEDCKQVPQEKALALDVFEHSLITLDNTPKDDLVLRLAGLLHDVGKPDTFDGGHFFHHDVVGAAKARNILRRWKFSKDEVAQVSHLIRHHMFWYESEWTGAAVRRFIRKVGLESVDALFALRRADNAGSNRFASAGRMVSLEELWQRVEEEVHSASAFSMSDLAISGHDVMNVLGVPQGPGVGRVMKELFERVLDDPDLNEREQLLALGRDIAARG
ncbi:MAG: HD domain-containing protein [Chloroflexi bacterium]|nr:HD domain-containing protein [Chloroflexota bacterium]